MAFLNGNKPIVTNGLVYALDFGNQKSYVSGSSFARSLLFNPTTAFVSGSPTFTSTGLLNLSSSSNVLTNKTFSELTINNSYTVSTLVQVKAGGVFWNQDASPSSDAAYLNTTSTGVGHLVTDSTYLQGADFRRGFNADLTQLTHITYRNYSGSFDVFINGVPVNTTGDYGGMLRGGGLNLNGRDNNNSFWSGSVGNFYIYNRALTSDEIYSNYLITAQRYGLRTTPKPYTVDENAYLFLSQSGITDPIITSSIDTFVRGLKANNLWGKMAVIYPFVGTGSVGVNLTGSHKINLKEPGINAFTYSGAWNGSISGSAPSGSGTYINTGVNPQSRFPNYVANNYHMSILSYDTPVSSSALMGTGMTKDLAVSTLAGDYGTPAAAYSVRKVRTAYSGALMDVRRSIDNVTQSIGYVSNGDLDTGSLLDWVVPGRNTLPGTYSGLAAAYSLRRVSGSYTGSAIQANNGLVYRDIGFDASGNLNTGSLTSLVATGSNVLAGNYSGLAAAYSLRRVTSSYSGFAIEVQSGSVSQSIGFDSFGNLDTGSLLTFVGSGNGSVKTWYDQSGNNNHATQSSAANQPQIVSAGTIITQSNRPTIQFDGSSDNLLIPIQLTTGFDIFKTIRYTNVGGYPIVLSEAPGVAGAFAFSRDPDNKFAISRKNQATSTFTSTGSNNQVYVTNHYSTGVSAGNITVNFRLNGGNEETAALSSVITGSTSAIGMGNNFDYFAGTTHEILIYSSSQASNRTYISNNINAYYNIYTTSSVSTENAFVSTWYDQSGNNRHATQTATGSQPLIVSSGSLVTEGTKPAVKFYTNLGMDTGFTGLVTKSLFIAASTEAGLNINDNGRRLFSSYTGGGGVAAELVLDGQGTGSFRYIDGGATLSVLQSASYQLTTAIRNSTLNLAFNGGSINSGGSPNSSPNTLNYRIGEDAGLSSIETAKSIQEVILYNNDQSSNRTLIENNINNYYSIYTSSAAGYVAKWYDQSGNNIHVSQSATASQPLIVLSGSVISDNSRVGIYFNDSAELVRSALSVSQVGQYTVYTPYDDISYNVWGQPYGDVYWKFGGTNNGFIQLFSSTRRESYPAAMPTSGPQLFSSFHSGNNMTSFLRGVSKGTDTTAAFSSTGLIYIGAQSGRALSGSIKEIIIYNSADTLNRESIEYGINNYYNIYPQTSSFATSSFTIYATTSSISASINNDIQSGIASSGPLGFITVSRTGSNSLTIAKNGVTSSFTVPASGALSTGIYLGAVNNNGIAVGSSPYNISFASVGTGLTGTEITKLSNLTQQLQANLGRGYILDFNPGAIAAFSLRKLRLTYTGSAINVRRTVDNSTKDIGFDGSGNLDIRTLITFCGSSTGCVTAWYDQTGNNNHVTQSTLSSQPIIVNSGSIVTAQTFQTRQYEGPNGPNNNTLPAIYFNAQSLSLGRTLYSTNQISYYVLFNLGLLGVNSDGYSIMATNTGNSSAWSYQSTGGGPSGYINMFQQPNSSRREGFPSNMPKGGTVLYSGYHTGSEYTVYVNNVTKGTNTTQQFGSGSFLDIGKGEGQSFRGSIQEIIFYPTGSTANRFPVENNINTFYQVY